VNAIDRVRLEEGPCICESLGQSLGESITQLAAAQGFLEIGAANIVAWEAATFTEVIVGYVRIADLANGGRLLSGSHELQTTTSWEFVQRGFNSVYRSEWEHLTHKPCTSRFEIEEKRREDLEWARGLRSSGNWSNPFDNQQGNPGYAAA
jgi:hypothetical protein